MQCDGQPDLAHSRVVVPAVAQELLRRIGPVDLEPEHGVAILLREPDVVEHRPYVQQFEVGVEASPAPLQRAEQEYPPGVVEEQVVLDISDELGGVSHERCVWNRDSRDRLCSHDVSVGASGP